MTIPKMRDIQLYFLGIFYLLQECTNKRISKSNLRSFFYIAPPSAQIPCPLVPAVCADFHFLQFNDKKVQKLQAKRTISDIEKCWFRFSRGIFFRLECLVTHFVCAFVVFLLFQFFSLPGVPLIYLNAFYYVHF